MLKIIDKVCYVQSKKFFFKLYSIKYELKQWKSEYFLILWEMTTDRND